MEECRLELFYWTPRHLFGEEYIGDIDSEGEPMVAFQQAEKLCEYLTKEGYEPMLVFFGKQGISCLVKQGRFIPIVKTFLQISFLDAEKKGTAWKLISSVYNDVVVEVFETATGDLFRLADNLYSASRIISCPYSFIGLRTDCVAVRWNKISRI